MAVFVFVRLVDEAPFVPDLNIDAGALQGTGTLAAATVEIEIPAAPLAATSTVAGTFTMELLAGQAQSTGQLLGNFAMEFDAGQLQATGQLLGGFSLEIDAGPIQATAQRSSDTTAWLSLNPPSEDVKDILDDDAGLALTFATDLFIGTHPDQPDSLVAVVDSPGEPADAHLSYERPHVQVMVRGDQGGYLAAHQRAQDIATLLHGMHDEVRSGARYVGIWLMGDVNDLGEDNLRRPRFTLNFRLHRTRVSG